MTNQIKFYTYANKPGVEARFEIISQITLLHGMWDHTSRGQIIKSVNRGNALAVVWDSGRSGGAFPTTPTTRSDTERAEAHILQTFREWLAKGAR